MNISFHPSGEKRIEVRPIPHEVGGLAGPVEKEAGGGRPTTDPEKGCIGNSCSSASDFLASTPRRERIYSNSIHW